jgi:hypothetical protein
MQAKREKTAEVPRDGTYADFSLRTAHDEQSPSFAVYPETNTYYCFGCGAHGDAIKFLMDKESMTYGQALEALERFEFTNELCGAAS